MISEAVLYVCGETKRDSCVRSKLHARKGLPKFDSNVTLLLDVLNTIYEAVINVCGETARDGCNRSKHKTRKGLQTFAKKRTVLLQL